MKKEEKTKLTRRRIIEAGILEFSNFSYNDCSINYILEKHRISKGLFYHNFESKEDLYLACVNEVLCDIKKYYQENPKSLATINDYLKSRQQYIKNNPIYANLFFKAIITPPDKLANKIKEIKSQYNLINENAFKKLSLREGISIEMAQQYTIMLTELLNNYLKVNYEEKDSLIDVHEKSLAKLLDILLYGIVRR